MTVGAALARARARLAAAGVSSPDLDAALLLAETLGVRRESLALDPDRSLSDEEFARFRALVERREERRPMAQILGRAEFWSMEFRVTPDVLSPRPETEMLVEAAVKSLRGLASPVVVDVGTGSGCIAVAIAREIPTATVHAVDLSGEALEVARVNVRRNGVEDRVVLHEGDLLAPLVGVVARGSVDVVVSNPPYVRRDDAFDPEILFEPAMALFVDDPPALYRRIADEAAPFARPGGALLLELSDTAADATAEAVRGSASWRDVVLRSDLAGLPRVLSAVRADHRARADAFVERVRRWAEGRDDVRAVALVGSHARGEARPDSDVDLVLLVREPRHFLDDAAWPGVFGAVVRRALEPYGRVTSVRVVFADGLEVEFGVAPADWASAPIDPGTAEVARGGMEVVCDRDGHVVALARGCRP